MNETHSSKIPILLNVSAEQWGKVMNKSAAEELHRIAEVLGGEPRADPEWLVTHGREARVLVTSWGCAPLSSENMAAFPNLELIVHAAGTLRLAFPEMQFDPQLTICTANHINARPVAEYTLGLILTSLRGGFQWRDRLREKGLGRWWDLHHGEAVGYAKRTVALVGFGEIAKQVITLLKPFGFRLLVVSDYVTPADEKALGIERVSLQDAAAQADVVSLHEADLPVFHRMIDDCILAAMKDNAVLINTARGRLIDEEALVRHLQTRPMLALLDVIAEEDPPPADHPLLHLPNCFLTPHVAGSIGAEIEHFGDYVVREIYNHLHGAPYEHAIPLEVLINRA